MSDEIETIDKNPKSCAAWKREAERLQAIIDSMAMAAMDSEPHTDDELSNLLWFSQEAACHSDPNYYCEFQRLATPGFIAWIIRELQERRKAEQDSEPVVWTDEEELRDVRRVGFGEMFSVKPITPDADMNRVIPLYRHAQPAQTGVDDDVRNIIGLLETNEWAEHCTETVLGSRLEAEITRLVGSAQPAPVADEDFESAWERMKDDRFEHNRAWAEKFWNACRAAMLQENPKSAGESNNCRSSENVQDLQAGICRENGNSSTNNCREIAETSTNRSREHFISLCNEFWNWSEMDLVCADDRGYELRMEWDGKVFKHPVTQALWRMYQAAPVNSPVIPEGYVMVPMRLTAENGAKGVLSGEFSETKFVNCPECFGDDECETCDGSGRIEITVPVTWTTIKEIWAKGVKHFAAAPQEVKGE